MKAIRQLGSFVLGIAMGVCVYSLLKLRPLWPLRVADLTSWVGTAQPHRALRPLWVQRALPPQICVPVRLPMARHVHSAHRRMVALGVPRQERLERRPPVPAPPLIPAAMPAIPPAMVEVAMPKAAPPGLVMAAASVPAAVGPSGPANPAPPAASNGTPTAAPPVTFKALGYVEKSPGQVEAIILQDNEIQVVHIGDLISGRFRVTKVSPELVSAVDELQSAKAKPGSLQNAELTASVAAVPQAEASPGTLGFVQQADGRVENVVADGDTVKLVADEATITMAQASVPAPLKQMASLAPVADGTIGKTLSLPNLNLPNLSHSIPQPSPQSNSTRLPAPRTDSKLPPATVAHSSYIKVQSAIGTHSIHSTLQAAGGVPAKNQNLRGGTVIHTTESTVRASTAASKVKSPAIEVQATGSAFPTRFASGATEAVVTLRPIGFVVNAQGEMSAIVSQGDDVYLVREGEQFADHFRAVAVSADAVKAVEEPPRQFLPSPTESPFTGPPELLSLSWQNSSSLPSECVVCDSLAAVAVPQKPTEAPPPRATIAPRQAATSPNATVARQDVTPQANMATAIFQTLGYVESQSGERQAVVADGSEVYLVKPGEVFAGKYLATSVDPVLVLAVQVSPEQPAQHSQMTQADPSGQVASNGLHGSLHSPFFEWASAEFPHEVGASGGPVLTDLDLNLLNLSLRGRP